MVSSGRIAATDTTASQENEVIVRINGVLPHITKIGTQKRSERVQKLCARENMRTLLVPYLQKVLNQGNIITYHLLFDIGEGITRSVETGISELGLEDSLSIRRLESKSYRSSSATSGAPLFAHPNYCGKSLIMYTLMRLVFLPCLNLTHHL